MIHLKHGAGDREGGYNPKHAAFDLTLVNGSKDKQRLIKRGLATNGDPRRRLRQVRTRPSARGADLRRERAHRALQSALRQGSRHLGAARARGRRSDGTHRRMELRRRAAREIARRTDHSAPRRPTAPTAAAPARSTTYTQAADVYIGDASSQVYEFIRKPRPCIFLNLDRIDWRSNPAYAHWNLGQVIESIDDLPAALARANELSRSSKGHSGRCRPRRSTRRKSRRRNARQRRSFNSLRGSVSPRLDNSRFGLA